MELFYIFFYIFFLLKKCELIPVDSVVKNISSSLSAVSEKKNTSLLKIISFDRKIKTIVYLFFFLNLMINYYLKST